MGLSVSAATVIIAIAVVSSALVLADTLHTDFEAVNDASDARFERLEERVRTALTIVNVTYDRSAQRLQLQAANTGAAVVTVSDLDILIDGHYATSSIEKVMVDGEERSAWYAGTSLDLIARWPVSDPAQLPQRILVVTGTGVGVAHATIDIVP